MQRTEFNSQKISLGHQHGCRCFVYWDVNMAAMTSHDNTLRCLKDRGVYTSMVIALLDLRPQD